jgi:hypothetical protein
MLPVLSVPLASSDSVVAAELSPSGSVDVVDAVVVVVAVVDPSVIAVVLEDSVADESVAPASSVSSWLTFTGEKHPIVSNTIKATPFGMRVERRRSLLEVG